MSLSTSCRREVIRSLTPRAPSPPEAVSPTAVAAGDGPLYEQGPEGGQAPQPPHRRADQEGPVHVAADHQAAPARWATAFLSAYSASTMAPFCFPVCTRTPIRAHFHSSWSLKMERNQRNARTYRLRAANLTWDLCKPTPTTRLTWSCRASNKELCRGPPSGPKMGSTVAG